MKLSELVTDEDIDLTPLVTELNTQEIRAAKYLKYASKLIDFKPLPKGARAGQKRNAGFKPIIIQSLNNLKEELK